MGSTLVQRRLSSALAIMTFAVLLTGCGTWWHGDHQSVTIFTTPPDAAVVVDERVHLLAPGTVSLNRKGNHHAVATKDGYESAVMTLSRTWSWWLLGDVFGCLIVFSPFCIMHDIDEGGYYTFDDTIYITLDRKSAAWAPVK
ncbi:PEGA domain-containing protein [Nitrospira moscoviensis]|uniref:Uncharacterized protein n=1 Tax=Nitrospira moscoviensis TaxID=42253 RepID=A0A0K2GGK6_NITMO|nr:PEGA domain-containing protein [Nitrospira moscoviensis]ALA60098.1 exported protein of unknown function [Nitrospira moscoviensis]